MAGTRAGTRFSGMWRPANTTSGSAGSGSLAWSAPAYSPSRTVTSPRRPPSRNRRGVELREAEGALGDPLAERLDGVAEPSAKPPEVLDPVVAAPDLVPVDHDPVAPAAAEQAGGQ